MDSWLDFKCFTRFTISTEKPIESSVSLFSFKKIASFYYIISQNRIYFIDASPLAIWCFSLRSKWCCSFHSQWCDVCTETLGEADIMSEGNIISISDIICQRQTSFKKVTFVSRQKWLFSWWERVDSNHRSWKQQIYSLSPLATREPPHKLVMGLEPATCWLQISCSANWATPANIKL